MRARTLILLSLALILAVGTALLARSYLVAQRQVAEAPAPKAAAAKSVLVARTDINRGQILRAEDLAWQVWPEGSLDKNYIVSGGDKKPESFVGYVAINPIASGEPVTSARMIAPGDRGFLAAVLRPGMRAISVPVTITTGIAGFIFPGDHVDLLLTYPFQARSRQEHKATETVLHDVRVIGMDQRLSGKPGEAAPAHVATFEVTPKQSEVIALATEIGKLSLTLHSLVGPGGATKTADATPPSLSDSFNIGRVTYTVDSEISPLLPKFAGGKEDSDLGTVTVLRGARRTSESTGSVPKGAGAAGEPSSSAGAPKSPAGEPTNSAGGT